MEYLFSFITKLYKPTHDIFGKSFQQITLEKGQITGFHKTRWFGFFTIIILTISLSISMENDKNENGKRPASEDDLSESEGKRLNKYKLNINNLHTQSLLHATTKRIPQPSQPLVSEESLLNSGNEREGGVGRKRTKSEREEGQEEEEETPAIPAEIQDPPAHQGKKSGNARKMTSRNARINDYSKTISKTRQECRGALFCAQHIPHLVPINTISSIVFTDMEVEEVTPTPDSSAGGVVEEVKADDRKKRGTRSAEAVERRKEKRKAKQAAKKAAKPPPLPNKSKKEKEKKKKVSTPGHPGNLPSGSNPTNQGPAPRTHALYVSGTGGRPAEEVRRGVMAYIATTIAGQPGPSTGRPIVLRDSRVVGGRVLLLCEDEASREAVARMLETRGDLTIAEGQSTQRLLFSVPGYLEGLDGEAVVRFLTNQNPRLPPDSINFVSLVAGPPVTVFVDVSEEALRYLGTVGYRLDTISRPVQLRPATPRGGGGKGGKK